MIFQLLSGAPGPAGAPQAFPALLTGTVVCILFVPALGQQPSGQAILQEAERFADQGDWYRAGPLYAQAEEQFRDAGDHKNETYSRLGRLHREAEAGGYRAVREQIRGMLTDSLLVGDALLRIRALSILGSVDLNLDTEAAKDDWNEVLRLATSVNDRKWQNRARGQLALIAGLNGDIGAAGLALFQAIHQASEMGDTAGVVHFSIWLANGMSMNGMPDRALPVIEKAEAAARNAEREPSLQLMIAKVRAMAMLPEPDRTRAQPALTALVRSTVDEARRKQTPGAQGEVLNLWGKLLMERAAYAEAEALLKEALMIARNASLPREEAESLLLLSQLYRQTGRGANAEPVIETALAAMRRVAEPYDLPRYIAEHAEVKAAVGALKDADALYAQSIDLIEGLLVNAPSSMVKSSMVAALGEIYVGHFRLAIERLNEPARAFAILESARGRVLYDSIRYTRTARPNPSDSAAEREITRLQRSLLHEHLTPAQTRRVLSQLDTAYDRLNPIEYERARAEMTMLRSTPASATDVRGRLGQGEALVIYLLDAKQSYALRITRSGLTVHKLPSRREFSQISRQYVASIRAKQSVNESAQALYKLAIAPVMTTDVRSLTIVPDGPLHLIPFAALTDEQGATLNSKLALTSVPSATVYATLKKAGRSAARRPFLGVAFSPDQRAQTSNSGIRSLFDGRGANLSPLPFGREEIQEAAAALGKGSVTLSGSEGSEAALKAQPLDSFKVVHVAAHGVSNEREPDRAALVLTPGSPTEDGLWQSREIRATRLNADVVVLSACETGTGRLQGQEGVMNLARVFLTAGARSVVASLWSVDDRSTATLMAIFYEYLAKGSPVRDALRQAQLQFVKVYGAKATPYHWAGFEVIGDGAQRITK